MLTTIKKFIPKKLFRLAQPFYHYSLSLGGAVLYRFPSRKIKVILITGTKGKSTTTELVNSILETANKKTALINTIRFKKIDKTTPNKFKMTTPGRFFIQKFLRDAVNKGCEYAIIETSSEAAKQFRHKFLNPDVFIFLNISPEHIESHGSYEKYLKAKLSIAQELGNSNKKETILIVNKEDKESTKFLENKASKKLSFDIEQAKPYLIDDNGYISFTFKNTNIKMKLRGLFNIYNSLAAANCADSLGIDINSIKNGLEKIEIVPGRVQKIDIGQNFEVIVDYAHTSDSLKKIYQTFGSKRKICVIGNTGGGRDTWKRPDMARVADTYCDFILLTNEDPYDENPQKIIDDMLPGISRAEYEIDLDRRSAIHKAISKAQPGDVVLISGKGTDPYIMGPNNTKQPWSDAEVAREELQKVVRK